jgi:tetratricopeptide (TPR) repeat protein
LSEGERLALRRLAVFAGGFALEAAEVVLEGGSSEVLETLASLTARSLVVADVQGEAARYRLLETVRQYAAEKLTLAGEHDATRQRHLGWCLSLAEAAAPHLRGAGQGPWLDRLELELDNFRAALAWAIERHVEEGLRIAAALRWFWFTRGRPAEGRGWLEQGLTVGSSVSAEVRGRALDAAAALAHNQGDYLAARTLQEDALRIWQACDDVRSMAGANSTLGIIAKALGEHELARSFLEEALRLAVQVGDSGMEATVQNNLAALAMDVGDYGRARSLLERSLAIKRELGDAAGIATSLHNLGDAALHLGEYDSAVGYLSESLAHFRQLRATDRIAQTLHSLGQVALRRSDLAAARSSFFEALGLFKRNGDGWGQALCMEGLAELSFVSGKPELAAQLFGAADAWRQANRAPVPPNDRAEHDQAIAAVAAALSDTAFQVAWAEGRARGVEVAGALS